MKLIFIKDVTVIIIIIKKEHSRGKEIKGLLSARGSKRRQVEQQSQHYRYIRNQKISPSIHLIRQETLPLFHDSNTFQVHGFETEM